MDRLWRRGAFDLEQSPRIYLAGRVCVEFGGVLVDERRLPGRQGRLVFAMLAAEHHRPLSRDEIGEQLWVIIHRRPGRWP